MTTAANAVSSRQAIYDSLNGPSVAANAKAKGAHGGSDPSSVQSTFLKLLTTQLQHQDPTNPVDSAQTTSQLAQIATVEGVTHVNDTLKTMASGMQNNDALHATSLVGHTVLVNGTKISLASGAAAGGVQLADAADSVMVTIRDSNGAEIQTVDLGAMGAGTHTFVWDGKDGANVKLPDGAYSVSVEASMDGKPIKAGTLQLGTVNSVTNSGGGAKVNVGDVGSAAVGDIKLIL
jgi:flagellar basal-body rod modification protein FlgD